MLPRSWLLWGLVIPAIMALGIACGGPGPAPIPTPPPTVTPPEQEPRSPVVPVSHVEPSIKNLELNQHTVFVKVGATVTWHNDDGVGHDITSDEGWFSGKVDPGGTFAWQPNQPGTYRYYCDIHKNIQGVIIASPGGPVAPQYYGGKPIAQYFADTCGGCHGPNRQGGTGPALIPGRLTAGDEFYFDVIKNGRPGTIMPTWGKLGLSDEEIWGLVGFIRSRPEAGEVRWDVEEIAESLEVLVNEATLPLRPQHGGKMGNLMLVTEREFRSIAVIDGDTHQLLGKIDASYRAHGYTFHPTEERWAYNVGRDGWVFKIDLYTLKAVRKVRVGHDSRGIAISDNGRYLIVGNYIPTTAVILDARTLEPIKVIATEGNDPDGRFVQSRVAIVSDVAPSLVGPYFIIGLKEAGQLWRIDWSKPDFPIAEVEDVGHILHDGFLSPDNKFFYIASQNDNWMGVVNVQTWELVDKISTGAVPHPGSGAAWEANGVLYGATVHAGEGTVTVWDLSNNRIVKKIPTGGPGLFLRSHEHSPYVWADALFGNPANNITVFDKETLEVVKTITDGVQTLHPEFTNDGRFVYVSDWQGNVVRVYDAKTFALVKEISDVRTPTGIFSSSRRLEPLGH